jgi:hypothetical protein
MAKANASSEANNGLFLFGVGNSIISSAVFDLSVVDDDANAHP